MKPLISLIAVLVIGLGLTRRLFTPDHRLVALPRSVD